MFLLSLSGRNIHPMTYTYRSLEDLIHVAFWHGFRGPDPDESEAAYRVRLAQHVEALDPLQALEIRLHRPRHEWGTEILALMERFAFAAMQVAAEDSRRARVDPSAPEFREVSITYLGLPLKIRVPAGVRRIRLAIDLDQATMAVEVPGIESFAERALDEPRRIEVEPYGFAPD